MFVGTYIGGSINFNAVAIAYDVSKDGNIFAAATAADNIISAVWVAVTLILPRILNKYFPVKRNTSASPADVSPIDSHEQNTEVVTPFDMVCVLMLSTAGLMLSIWLHTIFGSIPMILWLTTIALILAQIPKIHNLKGHKTLGLVAIYLFLTVIGVHCDIPTLIADGKLAILLLTMVSLIVLIHGIFIFIFGTMLKQDWDVISIASQANIGGTATAMVLAKSLKREELVLPAILIGALGNAGGSYVGILVAEYVRVATWL